MVTVNRQQSCTAKCAKQPDAEILMITYGNMPFHKYCGSFGIYSKEWLLLKLQTEI